MLWKCCTQYANKFGKLSSGHRTGKVQFSFQSQREEMPKNVQSTTQLHSSHTLAKYCSKFPKPGFNSMWTMNYLMFKLDLEKAEEPEIKLTHWKRPWCWERLKAGGEGDNREWDGWMASLTRWTWVWENSRSGDGQGSLVCCSPWGHKSCIQLSDWTELKYNYYTINWNYLKYTK